MNRRELLEKAAGAALAFGAGVAAAGDNQPPAAIRAQDIIDAWKELSQFPQCEEPGCDRLGNILVRDEIATEPNWKMMMRTFKPVGRVHFLCDEHAREPVIYGDWGYVPIECLRIT